ncbi:hypothetical protein [Allomesorhizobium alhagi]|jgi:hypothetical protein|uniref:Uncharacterized protein n=1 Tax=Mesorhizobium alhagi CCNWXJ12-2 TaxID=1107882 RepID=H0HLW4_9HYPH|nr:hypothetical protein [Mesorhizobium alhagi]EHK58292.1 hypothetical protein MAXJ12_05638 [Mesorhizobium alhagi CCNWXJ12-2]
MSIRLATFTALSVMLAAPAFADCREELTMLEQPAVTAETGAATSETGTATKHQEQVLQDTQGTSTETTGATSDTGAASDQVEAVSPHQEEVTGGATGDDADQVATLMTEARQMADAGDEAGCMQKVTELKDMMGKE